MKLIALQAFPYAGKNLKVDDIFESASDEDARILCGVGRAKRAEQGPEARALKADDEALFETEPSADIEPTKRRRYRRRDMRPEE